MCKQSTLHSCCDHSSAILHLKARSTLSGMILCALPPPPSAQLRELIEAEEEGGWPEIVLKCLQQKKKVDGVT